jgi:DNA-binding MarR family transcriptional regulator
MLRQEAEELHYLLFHFMGLSYGKLLHQLRTKNERRSKLKKNHVKILSVLYQYQNLTSTDIAKMLDIEKGSLTTLIDQLTESGLVKRCEIPRDRRKALVLLTDMGKEEMEHITDNDIKILSEILEDINLDDRKQFIANMKSVVDFLTKL